MPLCYGSNAKIEVFSPGLQSGVAYQSYMMVAPLWVAVHKMVTALHSNFATLEYDC